jgi:hypothetical protein
LKVQHFHSRCIVVLCRRTTEFSRAGQFGEELVVRDRGRAKTPSPIDYSSRVSRGLEASIAFYGDRTMNHIQSADNDGSPRSTTHHHEQQPLQREQPLQQPPSQGVSSPHHSHPRPPPRKTRRRRRSKTTDDLAEPKRMLALLRKNNLVGGESLLMWMMFL